MNYFNNRIKLILTGITLLTSVATISGCLKKQDNIEPTPIAVAYLINAAPKSDSVKYYVNNKIANDVDELKRIKILRYTSKTQNFGLTEGSHELSLSKYNDTTKYIRKSFSFLRDKFYTIFVVPTETSVEFIQREEFTSVPSAGRMKIRFANFLYGSPNLNLHIKNVGNAFQDVEFKEVTSFIELTPNNLNFQIKNSTDTTQIKLDQTMGTFEAGKSYTIITGGNWNTSSGVAIPAMWKIIY